MNSLFLKGNLTRFVLGLSALDAVAAPAAAPSGPFTVPVLVVHYFPTNGPNIDVKVTGDWGESLVATREKTQRQTREVVQALEDGSRYLGFRRPDARPSMKYVIAGTLEFLRPLPTCAKRGHRTPMTDYNQIAAEARFQDWVENRGVREVWIWGYHGGKVDLWESNMASPHGDVSNSDRDPKDLPVFKHTYTVYHYNYQRGTSEAVEDHMHQIEAVLNHVDGRDHTPPEQWPELLFWGRFVGSDRTHKIVRPGCGWSHYPPNAKGDYDWANPRAVLTDMDDWKPDGTGTKVQMDSSCWGGQSLRWFVYWMQHLPGPDNGLVWQGRRLNNWWAFLGDYDVARARGLKLTEDASAASGAAANVRVFHVATNGQDGWSGTLPAPNPARSDGPFATLGRARDAVRELKRQQGGALAQPVRVLVHGGTYALGEAVVFAPEDSGSANSRAEYEAAPGETPVLSGGRRLTNWKSTTLQGRSVWTVELPEVRAGRWMFHQLWVNGERRPRARHPNSGYLAVADLPEAKADTPWTKGQASFRFKEGDLKAWGTVTNAEVRVMNRWVESHLPVVGVNEAERIVRFSKRSVFKLDPGDLYYIENALELLDTPGEWYLDPAAGTLYYLPRPGEDMRQVEVIAPVLSELVRLEGRPEESRFLEHVSFRRLTFAHTEWHFPTGFEAGRNKIELWPPPEAAVGGFAQAAVGVPGAVRGFGVRQALFERCRWMHLGGYGLELGRGCQANRIARCELGDLGAGGIKLGETGIRNAPQEVARDNEVSDCHIHDGGRLFHSAIGVWVGQSPGNRLLHNHIRDFYYTGISLGWTWGYGRALATNTLVQGNHVHHIGRLTNGDGPILSDMAGIYTLGLHRGTVIRSNLWHDCAGLRYGGWGIYFDEGTTEILAEKNLVIRTTHGGFHQHYGRDNVVRNNIFVDARDFQIQRSRLENHRSFTFERNIVAWHRGRLLEGNFEGATNVVFASNLYWPGPGAEVKFWKWGLAEWRQRGQDQASLVEDPKFTDPAKDDYSLRPDSPALRLGFEPFAIGVSPHY